MQVHAASERMLGGENHDWLRKAKPFQLRFINTNLRLYQISRHYNHSNELMLIIMDTKFEEVSRDNRRKSCHLRTYGAMMCSSLQFDAIETKVKTS